MVYGAHLYRANLNVFADGKRYGKGVGLSVMLDGQVVATAKTLQGTSALTVPL